VRDADAGDLEILQDAADLAFLGGIEMRGRLVEEEDLE
jgi:hypothetical protein